VGSPYKVARAEVYLHTKWHLDPCSHLDTTDMGLKLGTCPFGGVEERSWVPIQHNVARAESYLHAKFHLDPSNHLATVQQRYRQTDRQTRQTNRQRSDSIGRTVFGRPFVKRFVLCYRTVVCPVCLSQPKPHCVRWGPSSSQKGHSLFPISAHVYCAKTVAHLIYC